jgi:hypothetical protein
MLQLPKQQKQQNGQFKQKGNKKELNAQNKITVKR